MLAGLERAGIPPAPEKGIRKENGMSMRTIGYLGAAAVAALSVTLAGSPAFADDPVAVLTTGSVGGANVAVGDVLSASLLTGTTADFASTSGSATGVHCATSTFVASVVDNPAGPGVATESTTAQTFGSCTANIAGVLGVTSVIVNNAPFATTVDSTTGAVAVSGPIQTTLKLRTLLGSITCVYQSDQTAIAGTAAAGDSSIAFADQQFDKASGSALCPSNGYFTANYSPVTDTSVDGSPAVYTN
jgi:hypothetical protein